MSELKLYEISEEYISYISTIEKNVFPQKKMTGTIHGSIRALYTVLTGITITFPFPLLSNKIRIIKYGGASIIHPPHGFRFILHQKSSHGNRSILRYDFDKMLQRVKRYAYMEICNELRYNFDVVRDQQICILYLLTLSLADLTAFSQYPISRNTVPTQ